ncbi:MAG: hypothetical protein NC925_02000 [Candidatus Omnitrophica bacterium]|nr:hypothetical protein [Candidatus Omnitrophota bacterium]
MDKTKIIPIILLIILLIVSYFAFSFYNTNKALTEENAKLKDDNTRLFQAKQELQSKVLSLEREIKDLIAKRNEIEEELNQAKIEKEQLQVRYSELIKERDELVEKLKAQPKVSVQEAAPTVSGKAVGTSEEYWVDFVKIKAQLEAKNDALNKELIEAKNKIAGLDKTNKELSIKIDELTKEKERLGNELNFKERTLSIISRDLVSEREGRKLAIEELNKLRSENVSLKRELILANNEKMQLQNSIKETLEKKDQLEKRLSEIDRVLREKSITLEELQEQMRTAVKGGRAVISKESASVELPPIVVKPTAMGSIKNLRGEVIAVNDDEKFIIINLGETSGLRPGTQLAVLRGEKEIATVEVIETRKEISAADIKEVASGFTIQKGDIVVSK